VNSAGAETTTGETAVLLTKIPAFTGAEDMSTTYGSVVYPTAESAAKSAAM